MEKRLSQQGDGLHSRGAADAPGPCRNGLKWLPRRSRQILLALGVVRRLHVLHGRAIDRPAACVGAADSCR